MEKKNYLIVWYILLVVIIIQFIISIVKNSIYLIYICIIEIIMLIIRIKYDLKNYE